MKCAWKEINRRIGEQRRKPIHSIETLTGMATTNTQTINSKKINHIVFHFCSDQVSVFNKKIFFLILLPLLFPPRTAGLNFCCYDAQRFAYVTSRGLLRDVA